MELKLSKDEILENYKDELTDAEIYAALARVENNDKLRRSY